MLHEDQQWTIVVLQQILLDALVRLAVVLVALWREQQLTRRYRLSSRPMTSHANYLYEAVVGRVGVGHAVLVQRLLDHVGSAVGSGQQQGFVGDVWSQ